MTIRLNFGCGSNRLHGWYNFDSDLDISKQLPFENNSIDFIFNEHVIEHITQQQAYSFFCECSRILKSGGVVRTTTPSLSRIHKLENSEYRKFILSNNWGDGNIGCGVKSIIFNHGHQCVYNESLLFDLIESTGLKPEFCKIGESKYVDLQNLEYHGNVISKNINELESFSIEATKL